LSVRLVADPVAQFTNTFLILLPDAEVGGGGESGGKEAASGGGLRLQGVGCSV
jgi:hypothetical protein